MTRRRLLASLGRVTTIEKSCVVDEDPGEVVRHARPMDDRARAQLLEQRLARLTFDPVTVAARERRIAIERGKVVELWRVRTLERGTR